MKKTILSVLLLAIAVASFSQSTPPAPTSDYYLAKSKRQKTAAWILLGGGVALIGVGVAATATPTLSTDTDNTAANVLAYTGLASSLGSIPLFISASKNKRKAASLSFNLQKFPATKPAANQLVLFQPAMRLQVAL